MDGARQMSLQAEIIEADLNRVSHQRDIITMTEIYARDPMGNGGPLAEETLNRLIPGLRNHPTTLVFLAYVDGQVTGIATCFYGFSTFRAKPLINIHDLAVVDSYRGCGIGRQMLDHIEQKARDTGCCKVTLEVQENNVRARSVYEKNGFAQAVYSDSTGGSLFYAKLL